MNTQKTSSGAVHKIPADFKKSLVLNSSALSTWEDITPLARNEWICWITSAKKDETRIRRIEWAKENLASGKRRPCCWQGCSHR